LIPEDIDYCIALDMDEVLLPGWRKELDGAFKKGATRPRYKYTWSWKEDGSPGLEYGGDKIHTRQGYRWKHPVHEVIARYGETPETQCWTNLEIHHHADNAKPRSQYLPLLKIAVDEDPQDDRNAFYYARELYFYGMLEEARSEFKRHLSLPRAIWAPERAASIRYLAKINPENAESLLMRAHKEDPNRREVLVELAQHFYNKENWQSCLEFAEKAISIKEKPLDYLCEGFAWSDLPYDLAALSAYYLKKYKEAVAYGSSALSLDRSNERLLNNLKIYSLAIQS
jgi:hypothetical protein